jgi:hypothetical protein
LRYALVFLSLFIPFSYFNHSDGWNQTARLAQLHAVVLQHTIRIDAYHEITGDKALIDGHYYSEKAPAIGLIARPSFALTVMGQRAAGVDPDSPEGWRVSEWITTAASIGLLAALGGVAFFALIEARLGATTALISTYGLFLGSLTFPYAASLFAHAGTIGLLAIALWATLGRPTSRRDYIAGAAAGLAVASEYPAILSCAVIGLYFLCLDRRRTVRFMIGTLPAAALILLNNYLMTGSPLQISYGSNPQFPEMNNANLMGYRLPSLALAPSLLWTEYRGLFFWSPALLMALPGVAVLIRRDRAAAALSIGGFLIVLLQVAAFYNWHGGNAIGLRYISPGLPFIGLMAAYGIGRFPKTGTLLTIVSVLLMATVTAIAIDPPSDVLTPLRSFYLARIEQDRFARNLGTLLGAPLWASLLVPFVLAAVTAWVVVRRAGQSPAIDVKMVPTS